MYPGTAKVRFPFRVLYFFCHPLKLSLSDGSQVFSGFFACRHFIEEHGQACFICYPLAYCFGKPDAVIVGRIFDRYERHHIYASHPGMLSGMLCQVDELNGFFCQFDAGFFYTFGISYI